ncbi:hypothetical protein KI659_06155 [Litoribacter alkaliphilus]|uniref:Uncharacterized protein n=1 Tax=Litoribacter ruber TaxID=702568 RepID=A0AAP2G161_9BACT|nr:hypothetical protein [Litoribacter alkaliphilus]MBS9523597.1 hypothetical protein [Litoribacter alkaliphilus]
MAEQTSFITLKGNVGRLNFYKTKNGDYQARQKGGVTKERIMTDPKYARTRENLKEFAEAAGAAKLIRRAIAPAIHRSGDSKVHRRFQTSLLRVVQSDPSSIRGERKVMLGEWGLIRGIELNAGNEFGKSMREDFTFNDDGDNVTLTIPEFRQEEVLKFPTGTTHYRLYLLGASINFEDATKNNVRETSLLIAKGLTSPEVTMSIDKTQLLGSRRLFVVGMEYTQIINGVEYPLNTMEFNSGMVFYTDRD